MDGAPAADSARFQQELEFVQCLANPRFVNCAPLLLFCLLASLC
jgi:hypothetical protein